MSNDPDPETRRGTTIDPSIARVAVDWGYSVRDAHLLEAERAKLLPEFQAWASEHTSDISTSRGVLPGWTLEQCALRWVARSGVDVPDCPIPSPGWSQAREIAMDTETDIRVSDTALLTSGAVTLTVSRDLNLEIEPLGTRREASTIPAGELHVVDGSAFVAGNGLEISYATPTLLRDYIAALSLVADLLETSEANEDHEGDQ